MSNISISNAIFNNYWWFILLCYGSVVCINLGFGVLFFAKNLKH